MKISDEMVMAANRYIGHTMSNYIVKGMLTAALHAEPCEPVAWQYRYRHRNPNAIWGDWGDRDLTLGSYQDYEEQGRALYASPIPSIGVDIEALQRRVEELEAALKPFAERANRYNEVPGIIRFDDSCELWQLEKNKGMEVDITVGDLRRARAALQEQKKDG